MIKNRANKKEPTRRSFLKQSGFLGIMFSLNPIRLLGHSPLKIGELPALRERFVPVSIIWDTANLIIKDTGVSWKLMDTISEEFNIMVSGHVLEQGRKFIPEMMEIARRGGGWDEENHPNVALVAGWLMYREIAKVYTSLYDVEPKEASLQRDVEVLKYKIQRDNTGKVSVEDLEDLFAQLFHRAAFRTHTLTPDRDDWNRWVLDYMDWYYEDRRSMKDLARQWVAGVPASGHFDPSDKLVKVANDYSIREITLTEAYLQGEHASVYGQALANATWAVKSLDEYFEGKISESVFKERIGWNV